MRPRLRTMATVVLLTLATLILNSTFATPSAHASVDDFEYSSWKSEFFIGIDDDARATLRVTETLVANFPSSDQNRGLIRGLPTRYRGAPLELSDVTIEDGNGQPVPWESETENGVRYLLIGDDRFVHGPTTYVISYTMRDVVLDPNDAEHDEFYWDLLPLDSSQHIDSFQARIRFDSALIPHLREEAIARYGPFRSETDWPIEKTAPGHYAVAAENIPAGNGVTVIIPLDGGVITPPPALVPDFSSDVLPFLLAGGVLAFGIGGAAAGTAERHARRRARGVIIAQYEVPEKLPPALAAPVLSQQSRAFSAGVVHLAVRQVLQIISHPTKPREKPHLRLADPHAVSAETDAGLISLLFPNGMPGATLDLNDGHDDLPVKIDTHYKTARDICVEHGWLEKRRSRVQIVMLIVATFLSVAAILFSLPGVIEQRTVAIVALSVCGFVSIFVLIACWLSFGLQAYMLTPRGAEIYEYLMGVKKFIVVAEADRIDMLQSYKGAERRRDGSIDVVHLYEKLLPYAILFGLEKQWSSVLSSAYTQMGAQPLWIPGVNGVGFADSLSQINSGLSASIATTSSRSSSGLGGGGFSGGGGGGGFSGGR